MEEKRRNKRKKTSREGAREREMPSLNLDFSGSTVSMATIKISLHAHRHS